MRADIEPKGRGVSDIINDLHEVIDELWRNYPPRITVKGWWWKRHFSHYRAKVDVLQRVIDTAWNERAEELREEIDRAVKNELNRSFIGNKRF